MRSRPGPSSNPIRSCYYQSRWSRADSISKSNIWDCRLLGGWAIATSFWFLGSPTWRLHFSAFKIFLTVLTFHPQPRPFVSIVSHLIIPLLLLFDFIEASSLQTILSVSGSQASSSVSLLVSSLKNTHDLVYDTCAQRELSTPDIGPQGR